MTCESFYPLTIKKTNKEIAQTIENISPILLHYYNRENDSKTVGYLQFIGEKEILRMAINNLLAGYKSSLLERAKGMKTPAVARKEEIECCNCGEDLALESYDWFGEGYEEAKKDFLNLIKDGKE